MSADNGIYIHKFRNGWGVVHAQAIDNIYWNRGKKKYNYNILYQYFKNAPRFKTYEEAIVYAYKLSADCFILEYGICVI